MQLKALIFMLAMAGAGSALAAPPEQFCDGIGAIGQRMVYDRDSGISYRAQRERIPVLARGLPDSAAMQRMLREIAKTVYVDMPQLSPEGAYKLFKLMCLSAE